jgi:Spy/CpxP family protein refolding chaperone
MPPGMMNGIFRMGGMFGGQGLGDQADPSHKNLLLLLKRNDVYTELRMTGGQKKQLEEEENRGRQEMMTTALSNIQALRDEAQSARREGGRERGSRDERMAQIRERGQEMMQAMTTSMENMEKKVEKILSPKQMKRLLELDLQWRGPLAMSDKEVADKVDLSPEQRAEVEKLLQEYRQAQMTAMQPVLQGLFNGARNGAQNLQGRNRGRNNRNGQSDPNVPNSPVAPNTPNGQNQPPAAPGVPGAPGQGFPGGGIFGRQLTPQEQQEQQARIDTARKAIEKARKKIGEKVLALLESDQKDHWLRLQGKPFAFRANL